MTDGGEAFLTMFVIVAVGFCGCVTGCEDGKDDVRRDAIRAGVAERIVRDPVYGGVEFRWIECPCDDCAARRARVAATEDLR